METINGIYKLIETISKGVGGHILVPLIESWKAKKHVEAQRIIAQGEVETALIKCKGYEEIKNFFKQDSSEVNSIPKILKTVIDNSDTIQKEKRKRNISKIILYTAESLNNKKVPDKDIDEDWLSQYFFDAPNITSEYMQRVWAKILAGQIERPNSQSMKTLNLLKNLNQGVAELFVDFCSVANANYKLIIDNNRLNIKDTPSYVCVLSLGKPAGQNSLKKYNLSYSNLNFLNEYGLINPEYNSWLSYYPNYGIKLQNGLVAKHPFKFQDKFWVIESNNVQEKKLEKDLKFNGVSLTSSGRELFQIVHLKPQDEYKLDMHNFLSQKGLKLKEVTPEVQI